MATIVAIDAIHPQASLIAQAVEVLRHSGLVVYPTRCLYGLGADATNPAAVARIFAAKGRSPDQPVSVICKDSAAVEAVVGRVTPLARKIMERFWPGAVTIVMEAGRGVAAGLSAGTGKIGVRRPAHPVALALAEAMGGPITATSANPSGAEGCFRVRDLPASILDRVDLVLDAGVLQGGVGSTVVDATGTRPLVLREGVVAAQEILSLAGDVFGPED